MTDKIPTPAAVTLDGDATATVVPDALVVDDVTTDATDSTVEEVTDAQAAEEVTPGKVYTAEEVTKIVAKRTARVTEDKIKAKVAELNTAARTEADTARTEADEAKKTAAELRRENEVLKLSISTGASFDVLNKTALSGQALADFAAALEAEKKNWKQSAAASLRSSVSTTPHTGTDDSSWRNIQAAKMRGN